VKKISGLRLPEKVKVFYELNAAGGKKNHWFLNWRVIRLGKISLFIYLKKSNNWIIFYKNDMCLLKIK